MSTQDIVYPAKPSYCDKSDEEWVAYCDRKMEMPGYICLAIFPDQEWYTGLVENSFSLGTSQGRTQFFWSGVGYDNIFGQKHDVDGWKDAQYRAEYYRKLTPGTKVFIFDARDEENLPVKLNWDLWLLDSYYVDGRPKNKYGMRNIEFEVDTTKPMVV